MEDMAVKSYEGRNVFVTGASGFIGSNLVRGLIREGASVICLVRDKSNLWRLKDVLSEVTLVEGNLSVSDEHYWKGVIDGAEIIFHLAAQGVHHDMRAPHHFGENRVGDIQNLSVQSGAGRADWKGLFEKNVLGTMALIYGAAMTKTCKRVILAGTSLEYGNCKKTPLTELDASCPDDLYGGSKACSSLMARVCGMDSAIEVMVLRLFHVYGPYELPPKLVPTIITNALAGEPIKMTGGEQVRDFLYVEDAVEAFLKAGLSDMKDCGQKTLNIGSSEAVKIKDVARKIVELTGADSPVEFGAVPYRKREIWSLTADTLEARTILGWKPAHTLEQGLIKTVDWFRKEGNLVCG